MEETCIREEVTSGAWYNSWFAVSGDTTSTVEACRLVINNGKKVHDAVVTAMDDEPTTTLTGLRTIKGVRASAVCLLTYDKTQFARLKTTIPVQLLFVLYRFDRVIRMFRDEGLARMLTSLVDSLDYTTRYQALYQPAVDPSEILSVHSLCLPRELVGLVVEYCRLDALALENEDLIIKRILAWFVS